MIGTLPVSFLDERQLGDCFSSPRAYGSASTSASVAIYELASGKASAGMVAADIGAMAEG